MKRTEVVKRTAAPDGVCLRLWTYNHQDKVETVSEAWLTLGEIASLVVEVEAAQQATDQYQLTFDN